MDCNGQARAGSRPPLCAPAPPRGLLFRAALTAPRRSRGNVICAASLRAHRKAEGSGEVAASISKSDTRLTLPPPPPPSRAGGRRVNPRHFLLSKNFSANLPISLDKRPNVCYYNNAGSPHKVKTFPLPLVYGRRRSSNGSYVHGARSNAVLSCTTHCSSNPPTCQEWGGFLFFRYARATSGAGRETPTAAGLLQKNCPPVHTQS